LSLPRLPFHQWGTGAGKRAHDSRRDGRVNAGFCGPDATQNGLLLVAALR